MLSALRDERNALRTKLAWWNEQSREMLEAVEKAEAEEALLRTEVLLLEATGAEAASEIERLRAALENLVIAIGMGWDLDGVLDAARAALGEDRT